MTDNISIAKKKTITASNSGLWSRIKKDLTKNKYAYLIALPVILYYIIFHYVPMYGAIIAFKDYIPSKGFFGSEWIGFDHFISFFNSYYFMRILKNTLVISVSALIFSFPAPIILAILLNEVGNAKYKRLVQTVTYMPHFISLVVICGLVRNFVSETGIITYVLSQFGFQARNMLESPELFVPIYVISGIWQQIGWGSIIYVAAIAGIDPGIYEAATIDGAGRWRRIIHITIPGIMPTIIVKLILSIGGLLSVGFEKIVLLYSPVVYSTADVISSFVYRKGLLEFNWSYSTAVGLFNSLVNCILLISANKIVRKVRGSALW